MFSQLHGIKNKYAVNAWVAGEKNPGINMWHADSHDSCYMWKADPPLWGNVLHGVSDWMMVSRELTWT